MKNANLSILIWANRSKADTKGMVPLYAKVTFQGKRSEISQNLRVDPDKWDAKLGFVKGTTSEAKRINTAIVNIKNAITQAYDDPKKKSIVPPRDST
jgi:hypothetical protein